ncbi:VOC family protein [Streptomyces sp. NPDC048566]|uniref:VOC family protein n=1 Tax=Streptomyces sp. NPDC048566 TaxID=3365569 RepID=UPI003722DDFA
MTAGLKTVIYPVKDIAKAKALFTALLGVEPYVDEPYYVGFKDAGQDVGLDPSGHSKGLTGPVPYWHVDDIEKTLSALLAAGAETLQEVQDVGGGRRIASVRDAEGNQVGLIQDGAA